MENLHSNLSFHLILKNDQNINVFNLSSVEKLTEYMPSLTTTIYETIHSIYEDESHLFSAFLVTRCRIF